MEFLGWAFDSIKISPFSSVFIFGVKVMSAEIQIKYPSFFTVFPLWL